MDILSALRGGPSTISQVANSLKVHPANLTRHFRTLEKAGLIKLDHTRDTGRNLEKYYRSVANTFDVSPEAGELSSSQEVALSFARSDLSAAIAQLPESAELPVLTLVATARVRLEDIKDYCQRLDALAKEFESSRDDAGIDYHINLNVYPGPWEMADGTFSIKKKE
jgi:predicted ArsR family transcriptional regulator